MCEVIMKKVALMLMLFCVGFVCLACGTTTEGLVKQNMSELTKVYFYGENDNFYCTLSSGERENEYLMNGISEDNVDFALLTLNLTNPISAQVVKVDVTIDGQTSQVELEINSLNSAYMVDLEKELTGEEEISVTYEGETLNMECLSKNFAVDYKQALNIASAEMEDKINLKKTYNSLNAECYLRVLDKKANNFDGTFWCFTVLNVDNENYSIIISTEDGSILAKSE